MNIMNRVLLVFNHNKKPILQYNILTNRMRNVSSTFVNKLSDCKNDSECRNSFCICRE